MFKKNRALKIHSNENGFWCFSMLLLHFLMKEDIYIKKMKLKIEF